LCIGQQSIEIKPNEITAIPEILNQLDIKAAVVSADALNCQAEIAKAIIDKQGHYLLSVKGNQGNLHQEIKASFAIPTVSIESETAYDKQRDHGRNETRRCDILPAAVYLSETQLARWSNLSTLIRITATREIKGKTTENVRYYISSKTDRNGLYYNDLVRDRWGIENHLHWHLDVTFQEDVCCSRTDNAAENLSTLRKFTLQSLQQKKNKLSLNKMRYKASRNFEYLIQIITI
jgi:predicted transposase YbfD/YdcC